MPSKYEKELYQEARRITQLCQSAGLDARPNVASLREYHLKLDVARAGMPCGRMVVYYAPSTKSFKHLFNEVSDVAVARQLRTMLGIPAQQVAEVPAQGVQIYVDGSYMDGRVGYGAVVLRDGALIASLYGRVLEDTDLHQVAGELQATMKALDWCVENSVREVQIFYDYEGIAKWATNAWKANKLLTQSYKLYIADCPVKIRWQKVTSHSGNRWNDEADRLAKQGALSKG